MPPIPASDTITSAPNSPSARIAEDVRRARVPVFEPDRDLHPVRLSSYASPRPEELTVLAARFTTAGFAVFEVPDTLPQPGDVTALAGQLGLGEVFTPPLEARGVGQVGADGVSILTAVPADDTAEPVHPGFGTRAGQRVHSDGTLQRIGELRTSLLMCQAPAAHGGESILFNSTAAFAALAATDEAAAVALMGERVLVRTANINGCTDFVAGPAFALADGRLLSRYSVTATDAFHADGVDAAALHRGRILLLHHEHPGSPYYLELTLAAGQGLLLANDRIGHGRRPFRDDATPRVMLRAVFTHPVDPLSPLRPAAVHAVDPPTQRG